MSRLLESETLTLLILLAIGCLAGYVLGADCKELLANLVSGLLGWLAKGAVNEYRPPAPTGGSITPKTED